MSFLKQFSLDPDVRSFICDNLKSYHTDNPQVFSSYEYSNLVKNHKYCEGYFQCSYNGDLASVDPHFLDANIQKSRAPSPLCAFVKAFKLLNEHTLQQMINGTILDEMNLFNKLCSCVSYQIHYGTGVSKKYIQWHRDCHNSMFHLALTVKGTRYLHYQLNNKYMILKQQPGDFYIASSNVILHGVRYPTVSQQNSIVAIQCRIELTKEEYDKLCIDDNKCIQDTSKIAKVILANKIVVPKLNDILKQIENKQKKNAIESKKCNNLRSSRCIFCKRKFIDEKAKIHHQCNLK